jgi:DNA-binding Lrp family transcriptional regulator
VDEIDRKIINELQGGFPICESPFAEVAGQLDLAEDDLIARVKSLLDEGILSRFGPMYHAERLGGGLSLVAMKIPEAEFDRVAEQVNAFPQVAHNYQRDHELNMWFVLATEKASEIDETLESIETKTGHKVYNMPKQHEFYVGLRFNA